MERKVLYLEILSLENRPPRVIAWTSHPEGLRGSIINPRGREQRYLQNLLTQIYSKHNRISKIIRARVSRRLQRGRGVRERIHDLFALQQAENIVKRMREEEKE